MEDIKSAQREVAIALQDFFVDKTKKVRVGLAPLATGLAWSIKRLTGAVGYEDLDQIQAQCPSPEAFGKFAARASALEKKVPAGTLEQLASLEDLKAAEEKIAPAPEM